jgi:hypothetical protein
MTRVRFGIVCLLLFVAHATCGGESASTGRTGDGGAAGGNAASGGGAGDAGTMVGGTGGLLLQDAPLADYFDPKVYADAGEDQWCKPETPKGSVTSCCGAMPCNGGCLTLEDGGKVCDCFGVTGGCPDGFACCYQRMGCTLPNLCGLGL